MPNSDLPQGTAGDTALSFDDGVEAISSLFKDPGDGTSEGKVEAQTEAEDEADQPEEGAEGEVEANAEEVDPEAEQEDDGSETPYEKGRFASDDAKVTLSDGTVTTVSDLKRNNLFQADYTRKTTELKQEREAFQAERSQVGQVAQSLAQQRDFLLQVAQQVLPKPPERSLMDHDPLGYMQAKAIYDDQMQQVNQLLYQQQAENGRLTQEQEAELAEARRAEYGRLLEVMPELKDRKVYDQFWNEATDTANHYGFTAEEWSALATDHRLYPAMRDLVKYRKASQQAPKVKEAIQQKPKLMQSGKRMDPKAKTSREVQARSEELRRTGDFDAGVRALMDLI